MSGTKPIDERVRDAAEEYRDSEIEYQLIAYLTRSNPVACGSSQKVWFSDILLQDVFMVVNDLRLVMSQAMLLAELNTRGVIGKDEGALYEEVVAQIYAVDISTFDSKNTKHMMLQVLRLYETRSILMGCGDIIGSMKTFNLSDAKQKLGVLSRPAMLLDPENAGMYLDDYEARVESLIQKKEDADSHENGGVGIPTGVYRFDRVVGGMMKKEFGVIAGITNVGKTAAQIDFGLNAWCQGYDVMLVSGEMSKEALEFRCDSYLTQIAGMKFRLAELADTDYAQWSSTVAKYRATQSNMLYISAYPRRFTVENIERDMLRIQSETGRKVAVVCCDYLNIMEPIHKSRGSNWEEQADAVWDFKGLVSQYDLVGWTAGQVKDEAYAKELYDAQDLKYARAISECAPVIIALIRTEKDLIENRMKLQVLKMRSAPLPTRPIVLSPNLDIMRIHQDNVVLKSLKGRKPDTMDFKPITIAPRPRKSLNGY